MGKSYKEQKDPAKPSRSELSARDTLPPDSTGAPTQSNSMRQDYVAQIVSPPVMPDTTPSAPAAFVPIPYPNIGSIEESSDHLRKVHLPRMQTATQQILAEREPFDGARTLALPVTQSAVVHITAVIEQMKQAESGQPETGVAPSHEQVLVLESISEDLEAEAQQVVDFSNQAIAEAEQQAPEPTTPKKEDDAP